MTNEQILSLKILLEELSLIKEPDADTDAYWVAGNISRENLNMLRKAVGLLPELPETRA